MSDQHQQRILSKDQVHQSGTSYESVTYTSGVYAPETPAKGLYVGGTGDVSVAGLDGGIVILKAMPVGAHPIAFTRIIETDTAATDLVAIF